MNSPLTFGGLWSRPWGRFAGATLIWDWTLPVALVVAIFSAGHTAGWAWCWIGPIGWLALVFARLALRLPLMRALGCAPDEVVLWFLGDQAAIRPARRAWPRIALGSAGVLLTGSIAATAWISGLEGPLAWLADTAWWFTLAHLIPLPPFDGAWFWRGLLIRPLGVRRAALATTGLGIGGAVLMAAILGFLGQLIGTLFFLIVAWFALTQWRAVRGGFDPVEDLPLPDRDDGVLARWRAARADAAAARVARVRADEDALLDRLLAKVSADGLPSLDESERRQLHAISERRRQESP